MTLYKKVGLNVGVGTMELNVGVGTMELILLLAWLVVLYTGSHLTHLTHLSHLTHLTEVS